MSRLAYLFERFPSFMQTFCYREVVELGRQRCIPDIFSIRRPEGNPEGNWDPKLVERVNYLPDEKELLREVERTIRRREISQEVEKAIANWGRQTDFLRLYQAAYIGVQLSAGVHLHAHFAGMAARTAYWIKQFFGVPFSFTAHANDIFAPRPFAIGLNRLIEAANAVVTESEYAANYLRQTFPQSAAKVVRVYNGLDLSEFTQANFATGVPLIISVGRLIEKKGFSSLVAACRILADANCNFRCEIIGEGPLRNALATQISEYNLDAYVTLVGAQTQAEVRRRLTGARLFALPCTIEAAGGSDNFPTVIAEAMACGLPVVSSAIAGIPEMVQDGVTGRLVAPNDVSALANAMKEFLADQQRAREFGIRGRQVAQEKFAIAGSVTALLQIFDRVR
jgi:colanic acid/amylovoran biosynthesis glycosyltransferase